MKWTARGIEQVVYALRLSDYPRSRNRALIDSLANGAPPYPVDEAEANGVSVNVNDLSLTRLSHEARMQLYQGFTKPGNFFTARTDMGSPELRMERGVTATNEVNRFLKRSDPYYDCMLSKLAQLVLHGIGPGLWDNGDDWCQTPLEIADVMVPGKTYRSFSNLPFFAVWRSYTPFKLKQIVDRAARNPDRNPGWNISVARRAIKWADEETKRLQGAGQWSEYWVPEKRVEREKESSGIYASDLVKTIDCWDFYFLDDANRHEGWRRRIIFDADCGTGGWGVAYASKQLPRKNLIGGEGDFLYDSGNRVVADRLNQILHFQFGDLSSVAPFRYHSVRGLGFLLYGACHLLNRLRCSKAEATFENLMMYLRVASQEDVERILTIELGNRRVLDESVQFVPPDQRWQPNPQLTELGLNEIKQVVAENSSSWVQDRNLSRDGVEKTKFQVMAEVQAMQTLVSAALQMAYRFQASEYREIFRRFMRPDSLNPDVREFRSRCLQRGIPERMLVPDAWDIEPERLVGGGNKTLEMAIAQQLMDWKSAYAPEAQQEILRIATLSIVDDAAQANALVPRQKTVTDSKQTAMLAFGTLMQGGEVQFTSAQNELEVCQTLVVELAMAVNRIKAMGGMTSEDKVFGLQNVVQTIGGLVESVAGDKTQADTVKKLAQISGNLANEVKGFAQRVAQQKKAQAGAEGDGGKAAELEAKITATVLAAKVKAENTRESHAARTAQRIAQDELHTEQARQDHAERLRQRQEEHVLNLQEKAQDRALDLATKKASAEIELRRSQSKGTTQTGD